MKMLLLILPTILLTSYSQIMIKLRVNELLIAQKFDLGIKERLMLYMTDIWILSAFAAAFIGGLAWLYVVEKYPVSIAFPAYTGILFAVVVLGSNLLLREPVALLHVAGVALIMLGVLLVSRAAG